MMSKKNYEAIAAALLRTNPSTSGVNDKAASLQWRVDVVTLELVFQMDNPRFDKELFRKACGYPAEASK